MQFKETSFTVRYNKIENINKKYYLNDEILGDAYCPATVLPVPDDAQLEIPRIVLKTKKQHSTLTISPIMLSFSTVYTDDYLTRWPLCKAYLEAKLFSIFDFLGAIGAEKYKFLGLNVSIVADKPDEKDSVEFLMDNLCKSPIENVFDFNIRYTFVENEKYFVNIAIQDARTFEKDVNPDVPGMLSEKNLKSKDVGVILDINDRYIFNEDENYVSSSAVSKDILELTTKVIDERLNNLVEKGKYTY